MCERTGIGDWNTVGFVLPDSIDRKLLIAVYKSEDPATITVMVYDNEERASARKIIYLADNQYISELLIRGVNNVFHDLDKKVEYTVLEDKVITSAMFAPASVNYNWAAGSTEIPGRREYERVEY
jgi:hypothetical protein